MINRRRALGAIAIAAFSGVESSRSFTIHAAELSHSTDSDLSAGLARLASRVYSEEGVPMFLACEIPSAVGAAPEAKAIPEAFNQQVAAAFLRYAGEWQHIHPDAPPGDVAKILELLADWDFASGGIEPSL